MMNIPDRYLQLESSLQLVGVHQPSSEVHGMIVGSIANHMYTSQAPNLLALLTGEDEVTDNFKPLQELLNEIYRDNSELLFENGENYELLLVDSEANLAVRTESLASWCKGYLLGLLYGDAISIDQLPEDGSEIARDFLSISEADSNDDEEALDEQEWALAELEEYVKVGSQLIFESIVRYRSEQQPTAPVQ